LRGGARRYNALDIVPLVEKTPKEFYNLLLEKIKQKFPDADINSLRQDLEFFYEGKAGRLNYVVDRNFSFSKLEGEEIDVVFSQVTLNAVDNIDNIEVTFDKVTKIVKTGGYTFSNIDLKTNTRWLRDKDPLSIYRYSDNIYRLLSFKGSPNRVRPDAYVEALKRLNWDDIKFVPMRILREDQIKALRPYLFGRFKECEDISYLSGFLFARKGN